MFNEKELGLIYNAVSEHYIRHKQDYDRQNAKNKKGCEWHLDVMKRCLDVQHKIFDAQNNINLQQGK